MFLIIWLHAYKYTFKGIKARTKDPEWAKAGFTIGKVKSEEKE